MFIPHTLVGVGTDEQCSSVISIYIYKNIFLSSLNMFSNNDSKIVVVY